MQEYIDFISRNPMLAAVWVGLFVAVIYSSIRALLSPVKQVSNREATMLINRENGVVLDVRSQDEFAAGHIIDAVNIPATQIEAKNLAQIEKHKDAPIIVVCESGMRATTAATALNKAGFGRVFVLRGGLVSWRGENLPVTKKR
jgi:rhodanese-related sulfurtransferase